MTSSTPAQPPDPPDPAKTPESSAPPDSPDSVLSSGRLASEVISACCQGDDQAWAQLVDVCTPFILAMVRHTCRGQTGLDVDDAVQEVFVRLCRQDFKLLQSFDPGRASLKTWIRVVAHSTTIDQLRKLKPTQSIAEYEHPLSPEASIVERLDIPMDCLTDRQRLTLRLLFQARMTVAQTARTLNVDAQTIRSTRHKALVRLREAMKDEISTSDHSKPSHPMGDEAPHTSVPSEDAL